MSQILMFLYWFKLLILLKSAGFSTGSTNDKYKAAAKLFDEERAGGTVTQFYRKLKEEDPTTRKRKRRA